MHRNTHPHAQARRGLLGLLVACLFAFQTSSLLHGLDIGAHDSSSDCEICDLYVSSNDDTGHTAATAPVIRADDTRTNAVWRSIALVSDSNRRPAVRAPPLAS